MLRNAINTTVPLSIPVSAFAVVAIAGCGRLNFGALSADAQDGASADTPVGAACVIDSDCGRCARCDGTGHCAVEPINRLFLGHRALCYIGAGGERWCSGENIDGQLGLGDTVNRLAPERAMDGGGWNEIHNSYYGHALGERNGQFFTWGAGTLTPTLAGPSRVVHAVLGDINEKCFFELDGTSDCPGASGVWKSLSVGGDHSCGVRTDGSLACCGTNRSNALGNAAFGEEEIVVAPSTVGTEMLWETVWAGGKGIDTASGGREVTCATKTDGRIYCWGHPALTGTNGVDVGATPTAISPDTDWAWLRLDWEHACAGKADGSVWCWGTDTYGGYVVPGQSAVLVPTQVPGTYDEWVMGGHHACGLTNGRWRCYGLNNEGELGIGTSTTDGQMHDLCP